MSTIQTDIDVNKVTYWKLLCNSRFFFAGFTAFIAEINFMHQESILAYRLTDKNLTTMQIGLFFAIYPVSYILYCAVLNQMISNKVEKRVILIVATATNILTFSLIGPSQLLNLPDSLLLMCLG